MNDRMSERLRETQGAFDSVAADYDGPRGNNELIQDMRTEMWRWLDATFPPGGFARVCPVAQTWRCARVHSDRAHLPLGDCTLPRATAIRACQSAFCSGLRAREHEQTHDLDAILRTTRILPRFRARIHS